jgi:hypothetical protein
MQSARQSGLLRIVSRVDRDAIARNQRRRQVAEALDDERGREAALAERLEDVVAESDGPRIDEQVFERLGPEDAALVGEVLDATSPFDEDEEEDEPDEDAADAEIERLKDEIAESRRRQLAYERYLDALEA